MGKFIIPTIQEAKEFASSIGFSTFSAGKWWHHYDANGWMRGKNKMAKWKSAVWTWFYDTEEYREIQRKKSVNDARSRQQRREYENYIETATEIKLKEMRKAPEFRHLYWLIDELRPEIKSNLKSRKS